jgi:signal transduction histidine kinase
VIFVKAVEERLIQVISNVMNNAIKFTNYGMITVPIKAKKKRAEKEEDSEITVSIKTQVLA